MLCRLYKEKRVIPSFSINPVTRVLRSFDSVNSSGVLARSSGFSDVSVGASYGSFTCSDFSIGNILAVGSFDKLQDVSFRNSSYTSVSQELDSLLTPKSE